MEKDNITKAANVSSSLVNDIAITDSDTTAPLMVSEGQTVTSGAIQDLQEGSVTGENKNSLDSTKTTSLDKETNKFVPTSNDGTNKTDDTTTNSNGRSNISFAHEGDSTDTEESVYECNICLDTAIDPIVSMCGHLFCWPCLRQMLKTKPKRKKCPVCKTYLDKDNVVPLYGRNCVNEVDPRIKLPLNPPRAPNVLNFGSRRTDIFQDPNHLQHDRTLSKVFIIVAIFFLTWFVFA